VNDEKGITEKGYVFNIMAIFTFKAEHVQRFNGIYSMSHPSVMIK